MRHRRNNDDAGFVPMFPTPTAGDGRIVDNNAKRRSSQPGGGVSNVVKVHCKQCGFPVNTLQHSNAGDLTVDGGGGTITVTSNVGDQAYRKGKGCPFCFSPNYK